MQRGGLFMPEVNYEVNYERTLHIGYHEASSAGYAAMGREAVTAGADTFAFFTRNPRGGISKPIDANDAAELRGIMQEYRFAPIVAHAPYTMNPCSSKADLRQYALDMLIEDITKLDAFPGAYYNLHPGCHTGQGEAEGIKLSAIVIAEALRRTREAGCSHVTLLIETMAGKGSEIGETFESIRAILDAVGDNVGVCLDTCHIWDAGYDIVDDLDGVLTKFDKTVGLHRIKAVHLNDSMNDRGSHKDRHQNIGQGYIGLKALRRVTEHSTLCGLPFILETPNEKEGYKQEIALLMGKSAIDKAEQGN